MGQSRKLSAIEAVANTAVGFVISLVSQLAIFGAYGIALPLADNVLITCWFTAISIARGYLLRRAFNRHTASAERWAPPQRNPFRPPPLEGVPALTQDQAALIRERFDRESA